MTGYTARLIEKGQTFPEFALTCARAFGALLHMREDSMDAPVPEEILPDSQGYTRRRLAEALANLDKLAAFPPVEQLAHGATLRAAKEARFKEWRSESRTRNEKLRQMQAQVSAWLPPTPGHDGLKKFMLQQLEISFDTTEWFDAQLVTLAAKTDQNLFEDELAAAHEEVVRAQKDLDREVESATEKNHWLKALRSSLSDPQSAIPDPQSR